MVDCWIVQPRRIAAALIIAICLGGPIAEIFDQWDHTFEDGNDTEANVIVAALCVGFALALGTAFVLERIRARGSNPRPVAIAFRPVAVAAWRPFAAPVPTSSPPIPLRI